MCAACYSFVAVAVAESAYKIFKRMPLTQFSTQQVVDCSAAFGNVGCTGGWFYWAWEYLKTNSLMTEISYPYFSGLANPPTTGICRSDSTKGVLTVANITYVNGTT
jgi:cathepsin L